MLCWFGSRCFSAVSSWGVGWRMLSSSPVSPALSLLACGPHLRVVITIPGSPSTPLITVLTLTLCRSFTLRFSMVFCAGFPLLISWLLDMSLFMSTSFWFWREKVYGHDLYFLTCWALYMYSCVWSLMEVFGITFECFKRVKKHWISVSKLFCMQRCMCMWFCVMVCSARCLSLQGPHWQIYWCDKKFSRTEHLFTNPHSRLD